MIKKNLKGVDRVTTSLTIDKDLLIRAKEKGINISMILNSALSRELNVTDEEAFKRALELNNKSFQNFIERFDLQNKYEEFKYGHMDENVSQGRKEIRERDTGQIIRDFKAS